MAQQSRLFQPALTHDGERIRGCGDPRHELHEFRCCAYTLSGCITLQIVGTMSSTIRSMIDSGEQIAEEKLPWYTDFPASLMQKICGTKRPDSWSAHVTYKDQLPREYSVWRDERARQQGHHALAETKFRHGEHGDVAPFQIVNPR